MEEELALARRFLDIERVRFGSRLNVEEVAAGDATRCLVPPLLLQPLVENAVAHGVAGMTEGGSIRIEARREGADVVVAIENTFDSDSTPGRREGRGLANVRRRLQAIHSGRGAMQIRVVGDRYRVELVLPAEET